MNRKVKRIAVVSYLGLVGALGATTVLAEHAVGTPPAHAVAAHRGDTAPAFMLRTADNKEVSLKQLRGENEDRIVVLEWFDPNCEWVKAYHARSTAMHDLYEEFSALGVHWAAVYSSAPPEERDPAELNRAAAERWNISYPILLDADRSVAKLYGINQTPTVVVISSEGEIIYKGSVDSATDPTQPGKTQYLRDALDAALHGERPEATQPIGPGCHLQAKSPINEH